MEHLQRTSFQTAVENIISHLDTYLYVGRQIGTCLTGLIHY